MSSEDDSMSYVESLNYTYSAESSSDDSDASLFNRIRQLTSNINRTVPLSLLSSSSTSVSSTSSSSISSASKDELNILITGSKCTGKTSLCETLLLHLSNNEEYNFEYIDVNGLRNQFNKLSLPLSENLKSTIHKKLNEGNILIEDTNFDIYFKYSFSVIFILKTEDDELEKRLICHGDFNTPYNDFHVMEPYNSVCEKFPYTKNSKIFILDNTLDRHLDKNAKLIKKWIDEYIDPPDKFKPKNLDSDGESHRSDSDDSDANETLIHTDGKFKKPYLRDDSEREMHQDLPSSD